jgi:alanyl-tRNA synthetase
VRRIEAVTGAAALAYLNAAEEQLKEAASLVKGSRDNLIDKLSAVLERNCWRGWRPGRTRPR